MTTDEQNTEKNREQRLKPVPDFTGLPGWCALILVALLPFAILPVYGRVSASQTAFFQFAGLFLIPFIAWEIARVFRADAAMFRRLLSGGLLLDFTVLLTVGSVIFSYLITSNAHFLSVTGYLAFASFYLAFRLRPPSLRAQQVVFVALIFTLSGHAILARLGWNPFSLIADLEESRARGSFITLLGHPNYLGSALVLLAFLVLQRGETKDATPSWLKISQRGALVLVVITLLLIGARGAFLALALGGGAWYVAALPQRKRNKFAAIYAIGCAALLLLLGGLFLIRARTAPTQGPRYVVGNTSLPSRAFSSSELNTRLHGWAIAWEVFKENPVFGIGVGRFDFGFWSMLKGGVESDQKETQDLAGWPRQIAFRDSSEAPPVYLDPFLIRQTGGTSPGHAHNEFFHAATEGGLVGAGLLILLFVAAASRAWRANRPALFAALLALGVDGLFNFPLHLGLSAALAAILFAAIASLSNERDAKGEVSPSAFGGRTILALVALLLLCFPFHLSATARRLMGYTVYGQAVALTGGAREATLRSAVKFDPTFAPAKRQLYDYLVATGQIPAAAGLANELIAATGAPTDLFRLGEARLQAGDFDAAAQIFATATALNPGDVQPLARRLRALRLKLRASVEQRSSDTSDTIREILATCDALRRVDATHPAADIAEATLDLIPSRDGTPRYPETARARFVKAEREVTARLKRARDENAELSEIVLLEYLRQEIEALRRGVE